LSFQTEGSWAIDTALSGCDFALSNVRFGSLADIALVEGMSALRFKADIKSWRAGLDYVRRTNLGSQVEYNPARLNSDTSHMADNRHTEKKYEHTNRSCNQKTPARVPRLSSGLGGSGGPSAFLRVVQIEWLYSGALLAQAA
jgi:hypothetical protein